MGDPLSDAEWKVMNVVWRQAGASTSRQVLEEVGPEKGWAYTTVKTMMDRLVEKGALEAELEGRTTLYLARLSRRQARLRAARSLVDKAFGGAAGSLMHLLIRSETLSPEDRDELRRMLEDVERGEEGI